MAVIAKPNEKPPKVLRITFGGIPAGISGDLFSKMFSLVRDIMEVVIK
jgi:hypothetical protein